MKPLALLPLTLALLLAGSLASAQRRAPEPDSRPRVYLVASGDTLSSIAQRLGVSTHALAERNHLEAPFALRRGRALRLPEGVTPEVLRTLPVREGASEPSNAAAPSRAAAAPPPRAEAGGRNPWGRSSHPGRVQLVREYNNETVALNLARPTPNARRRMEHFLRFTDGQHHPIDARLLRQLALVSDHFGGRSLHVISGFRPRRQHQYTRHSNHNIGHAIDFRVEGVPNRVLRDYCRTLPNTGCGWYPRSVFVHMDVREQSAYWIDWSRPGQPPSYGRLPPEQRPQRAAQPARQGGEDGDGDESVDEVASDSAQVRNAPAQSGESEEQDAGAP